MVFEIFNWNGGISPYEDRGIKGAFKFGSNLNIRRDTDSLISGQALEDEGIVTDVSPSSSTSPSASVSPSVSASQSPSRSPSPSLGTHSVSASRSPSASQSPSASLSQSSSVSASPSLSQALTSVFRDLIYWFVKATDGNLYGFGSAGFIYKRDPSGNWSVVHRDTEGAIKGAAEWWSNTGDTYLYWATNRVVKRKKLPGVSSWNDVAVVGTDLQPATWHTMAEAGGSLIIANKTKLGLIGYDDSYTSTALDLIPGNVANTIVERNGRTIAGTARVSDPNKGVNAAIDSEVPLAQVGNDGEVFYANMVDSIPAIRFPGGGRVNPGAVANQVESVNFFEWEQTAESWIDKQSVGNMAMFGVFGGDTGKGGIYTYGRKKKDQPFTLNLEYLLDVNEIGAVTIINGTILASYYDGSVYGVKAVDSSTKATGTYEGLDFHASVKKPVNITTWSHAELWMDELPSGSSVQFWYRLNKTGSFVRAETADGNSSYSVASGTKAVFRIQREGEVFEPKIVLVPYGNNSPEVFRLRVYFN